MRAIDRLRKYITREKESGNLHPGVRLPSYGKLAELCGASYVTIHSAMSQLQREGLINIEHGNGTYLSGGSSLKVRLRFSYKQISPKDMDMLLKRHLKCAGLKFEFEFYSLWEPLPNEEDAITIEILGKTGLRDWRSADFSNMENYKKLLRELELPEAVSPGEPIPFAMTTYQMGVNSNLFSLAGVELPEMTGDFPWWDKYADGCKKAGFAPASVIWNDSTVTSFDKFYGLLLALNHGRYENFSGNIPLFNTQLGQKFLKILENTLFSHNKPENPDPRTFAQNGAGAHFKIGSWISVQNNNSDLNRFNVDGLQLIPYSINKQRIFPVLVTYLYSSLPPEIGVEERSRVWSLIQLMLSREFQRDYCGISGTLSSRSDFGANDYSWNNEAMWGSFIPTSKDIKIYEHHLFSPRVNAAMTTLIDAWKIGNADSDFILQRMDSKKAELLDK